MKNPTYPKYVDGEIILGSHCFCGFVCYPHAIESNGNGHIPMNEVQARQKVEDKDNYLKHLYDCPMYKK